ncbi:MAG: TetR/AcrR family transcriptional regulator, partial [Akkermansiaceae bacterium]|nr:TetR/AcrR family transcriptional regulator [Akkermansiaceae bacterium]
DGVDGICKRAELGKGSFYHFFKSKTALAIAALDHLWETQSRPDLDEIFADAFRRMIGASLTPNIAPASTSNSTVPSPPPP